MRLNFRKKTGDYSGISLSALAWRKFRKNAVSLTALSFIIVCALISVLGYLIVPDSSPFSNSQNIELAAKNPGFKSEMLLFRKNKQTENTGFFKRMIFGKESDYICLPFYSYYFSGDSIYLEEITGDNPNNGLFKPYNIVDAAYALNPENFLIEKKGNELLFKNIEGVEHRIKIEEVQQLILDKNIITQKYLLGTDRFGRDMLSRIIIGARVSLSVGLISVLIALTIGIILGALAGYYGKWADQLIVWLINVVWSIPTLLLVIAITFALGRGFWQVFVAVGLTMWVDVARVVRGQVLGVREKEFVEAGRALGFKNNRIIFRHILPNIMGPVFVITASNFASAILMEAGLSFLGIGVQPPMPSWGTMIREHSAYIILDSAWLAMLPGLAIMLTVLSFMLIGNGLRDAMDVRLSDSK